MARIEGAGRADLFTLDPETVVIPEDGPLFDERADLPLDENLVANIMFQGVLEPIIIRKNGSAIEVVAGRQRVKAAREANRRFAERGQACIKIPAILKQGTDADMYGILISENEIRRADDQVAKGKKALRLVNMGQSVPDIAVIFGVSTRTIEQWLSLNDLTPEVQDAVSNGEISAAVGRELSNLPREEQAFLLDGLKTEAEAKGRPITKQSTRRAIEGQPEKPKMATLKQIQKAIEALVHNEEFPRGYLEGVGDALAWVLGRSEKTWEKL